MFSSVTLNTGDTKAKKPNIVILHKCIFQFSALFFFSFTSANLYFALKGKAFK